jgi:hypothetical protein
MQQSNEIVAFFAAALTLKSQRDRSARKNTLRGPAHPSAAAISVRVAILSAFDIACRRLSCLVSSNRLAKPSTGGNRDHFR